MDKTATEAELRRAFSRRLHEVVDRLADTADHETIMTVLSLADPISGMGVAMQRAVVAEAAGVGDPKAAARLRGVPARRRLIEDAGGLLRPSEAAGRLGVKPKALAGRRRRGTILAVPGKPGEWLFPACQFGENGLIPGMPAFLRAFDDDVDPWSRLSVALATSRRFGTSALELLTEGRTEDACSIAGTYGEQG